MGNHPVRFLGEGAAAMPLPYPTATPALKVRVRFRTHLRSQTSLRGEPRSRGARGFPNLQRFDCAVRLQAASASARLRI